MAWPWGDLGQYNLALADYRKTLEIYPQHDRDFYNIGGIWWNQDKHAQAIDNFNQAIALNSTRGVYWYGLALAQCGLQDNEAALQSVQKAIMLGSDVESITIQDFEGLNEALA